MFSKVKVKVGDLYIGGDAPVSIQSMTNTDTKDVESTLNQIIQLHSAGADLVRVAVRDMEDIDFFKKIVKISPVPIVADIHYDYRLAIECIKAGASKIRINPGNIGADWKVKEVVKVAKEFDIPIRVGSNSGSIKKDFENLPRWKALAESALYEVRLLEKLEFFNIVISAKSTDPKENFLANKYIKERVEYPLHIGVTEAGIYEDATILSSAGLGALLLNEIGDTIRISIAGNPIQEVLFAKKFLTLLNLKTGIKIVACPTCARSEIDVEKWTKKVKNWIKDLKVNKSITIAVMGCVVNGMGESKHSDIGITGTKNQVVIFAKGKILKTVPLKKAEKEFKKVLFEIIKG